MSEARNRGRVAPLTPQRNAFLSNAAGFSGGGACADSPEAGDRPAKGRFRGSRKAAEGDQITVGDILTAPLDDLRVAFDDLGTDILSHAYLVSTQSRDLDRALLLHRELSRRRVA